MDAFIFPLALNCEFDSSYLRIALLYSGMCICMPRSFIEVNGHMVNL